MDIGAKLKQLRQQRGLTQEELADRCELTKGFISQVERNLASPSIATLMDMLECLGVPLPVFFNDKDSERIVFTPQDMFVKEDAETLRGTVTWLVPDAQKNEMEPILVELGPGGQTDRIRPRVRRTCETPRIPIPPPILTGSAVFCGPKRGVRRSGEKGKSVCPAITVIGGAPCCCMPTPRSTGRSPSAAGALTAITCCPCSCSP